jgi:5'(3')-deoxyribonucleotidase
MRVLIDMDEVLVDFIGGVAKRLDTTREVLLSYYNKRTYGILDPVNRYLASNNEKVLWAAHGPNGPIYKTEFTDDNMLRLYCEKVPDFWYSLEPLPWALELIKLVSSFTDDWWIVSAPWHNSHDSYVQKRNWVFKHLEDTGTRRFIPLKEKHLLANPRTVLIDEAEKQVTPFIEAGGCGLLFPHVSNHLHYEVGKELEHVKLKLDWIKESLN